MTKRQGIDREQVWKEFGEVVNMTASALNDWLGTEESRQADRMEESRGKATGHDACRGIVQVLHKKKTNLTDDDYALMQKVVGYVHHHLAQGGPEQGKEHSAWRHSLMNRGHDPMLAYRS